jgi:hypothetical protein
MRQQKLLGDGDGVDLSADGSCRHLSGPGGDRGVDLLDLLG